MITRSENTPTFSHWPPAYVTVSADNRPRTNPPSAAPLTFPMPPRTAAVNAFSPAVQPRGDTVLLLYRPYISGAAPASTPPGRHGEAVTTCTSVAICCALPPPRATAR